MDRKMVPLHRDKREMRLWKVAEETARERLGVESAREGVVLAAICAEYLGEEGPE